MPTTITVQLQVPLVFEDGNPDSWESFPSITFLANRPFVLTACQQKAIPRQTLRMFFERAKTKNGSQIRRFVDPVMIARRDALIVTEREHANDLINHGKHRMAFDPN